MTSQARDNRRISGAYDRAALVITEFFNPPWVVIALLGAVSVRSTDGIWEFLGWWAISAALTCLLPLSFLLWALSRGRTSGWHLSERRERIALLSVTVVSCGAAALVASLFSAPRPLLATILAVMMGLLAGLGITVLWKISGHTTALAGTISVLTIVFGGWALLLAPLVPLVGWARVRIAHHTVPQVIGGACNGAAVAAVVYMVVLAVA